MTVRSINAIANGLDMGGQPDPEVVDAIHQEQGSKKFLILDALHKNGKAQTVGDLVHWTKGLDHGLNTREITRLLWALQKMGYVKFIERSHDIVKIELTPLAAKDLWPHERKAKAPVEKLNRPTKPKVVPSPEYVVPEPPRYATPEPPAQNVKTFTDVESTRKKAQGEVMEAQVMEPDTHTQYLKEMAIPYANSPGTATSRQRVLRFLRDVIATIPGSGESNWVPYTDLRDKMGMKSGNTSVLVKSASEFEYVDILSHTAGGTTSFRILDRGRQDVEAFADVLDKKLGSGNFGKKKPAPVKEPFRGHAPADQSILDLEEQEAVEQGFSKTSTVKPMKVVARDEADAVKKVPDLTDYPLLVELLAREAKAKRFEQAAEILMADDENIALNLLSRVEISDEQRQMISFIRAVIGS